MQLRVILALFIVSFCFRNSTYCQKIYINAQGGIFQLTGSAGTCTYTQVPNECGTGDNLLSIAIYKDTLYYNTWAGDLKRFVIGVPGSCRTLISNGTVDNALTVDKNGILYMAGRDDLRRYDPNTNQLTYLGKMPFYSAGDLIFFMDKLLMAGSVPNSNPPSGGIFEINTGNPSASILYMSTPAFYGLISYPVPCGNSRYFGISSPSNSLSNLTEINLQNKTIIGQTCSMPVGILDAASSTESGMDHNVAFTNVQVFKSCEATIGSVQAAAVYPSPGTITYQLDNGVTNTTGFFADLPQGNHTIKATAPGGCSKDTTFAIIPAYQMIKGVTLAQPAHCEINSGRVTIDAASSFPPVQYTWMNTGATQPSKIFEDMPGGTHHFRITDAAGCTKDTIVQLTDASTALVDTVVITTSRCDMDNGEIKIILHPNNAAAESSINDGPFSKTMTYSELFPGAYRIQVKNGTDCMYDSIINIPKDNATTGCFDTFIPNAFTPGNDGRNDTFKPSIALTAKNIVMRIFNRWGQMIYEGRGHNVAWDGNFKGSPQPTSVYVYMITYTSFGVQKSFKGTFTLIR